MSIETKKSIALEIKNKFVSIESSCISLFENIYEVLDFFKKGTLSSKTIGKEEISQMKEIFDETLNKTQMAIFALKLVCMGSDDEIAEILKDKRSALEKLKSMRSFIEEFH